MPLSQIIEIYQEADGVYSPELHERVKIKLIEGHRHTFGTYRRPLYSDLASVAAESVISDFRHCLEQGRTFSTAVGNLNYLEQTAGKEELFSPTRLVLDLRESLYGRSTTPKIDFAELLASLLDLKNLRPDTYYNSLNAAKWAVVIACAIDAYNKREEIKDVDVDPRELFTYSLLMNYGMLHPDVPNLEGSKRKISDEEREKLDKHPKLGLEMLLKNGIPKSEYLWWVVGSHKAPEEIISAIALVAEAFEAIFFKRRYRTEKIPPKGVFKEVGINLFGKPGLKKIEKETKYMLYRYYVEEIRKNPLKIPYQMMRLLFGILDYPPAA